MTTNTQASGVPLNYQAGSAPTGSSQPLRAELLAKRFRQGDAFVDALRDVSLSVDAGEFIAIMGASGSGKSTLLHLLAGLTPPDRGRVLIGGQDLAGMSDRQLTRFRRKHIGLVFQAFNLIPTLTAEENILLPAMADHDLRQASRRLEGLLDRLGLAPRRRHRPDALSGGEQQRVAIARALLTEPSVVLADEPTGSLDSTTGQAICRLLRELCEEQRRAIIVVTHEPAVATWAQRVLVLKDGCAVDSFDTSDHADSQSLAAHYQQIAGARRSLQESHS